MAMNATMVDTATLPPIPNDQPGYTAMPAVQPSPSQLFGDGQARPVNGIPRFELVSVLKTDGSYVNVEYVSILMPGDPKSSPRHKVTDYYRAKYRPWYEAFRRGLTMAPDGAPLEMWPIMTPAQVHHLKSLNIFTVEQLAAIPDSVLHNIPMGMTLRNQANAWLKEKKSADDVEARRRHDELLKDNQRMMEQQMVAMQAEINRLKAAQSAETPTEPRRGPGRPPKAQTPEAA